LAKPSTGDRGDSMRAPSIDAAARHGSLVTAGPQWRLRAGWRLLALIRAGLGVTVAAALAFAASAATAAPASATVFGPRHPIAGSGLPARATTQGTGWSVVPTPNPKAPTGQLLFGTCASASSCVAVGTHVTVSGVGVTLAERWNGSTWAIQPTPNPAGAKVSALAGVACTSSSACTAVGYSVTSSGSQLALAERWDGTSWQLQ